MRVEARPRPPQYAHQSAQPRRLLQSRRAPRRGNCLARIDGQARGIQARSGHPITLKSRNQLALAYSDAGRTSEAVPLLEATLEGFESTLGPDHPGTLISRSSLAAAYAAAWQFARAEPLLRDSLERARKVFGPADPRTAGAMAQLGLNLLQQSKWIAAESVLRECLATRTKTQPDDWSTFNTQSQLGGSLLGQNKFAEAETLIVSGYEGMKAREARIPSPGKSTTSPRQPSGSSGSTTPGASPTRPESGGRSWA